MSFFDDVKDTLVTAGKDVSQKAKEVSGVAKLKMDRKAKQDFVEKQYAQLGMNYYKEHKEDVKPEEEEQFRVIEEAFAESDRMNQEILKIQGALECPKCGNKMPENATFCSKCGTKLDDMFEE